MILSWPIFIYVKDQINKNTTKANYKTDKQTRTQTNKNNK